MTAIKSINVKKLKSLHNISATFEESGVFALMGGNGSGKSTFIHALACLYSENKKNKNSYPSFRWSNFFIPHTENSWSDSEIEVNFYGDDQPIRYAKAKDRWTPRYERRPQRTVIFFGIKDYVPHIELEKYGNSFKYTTEEIDDKKRSKIVSLTKHILERDYINVKTAKKLYGTVKKLIEVSTEDRTYISYYMGAGELKVFNIVEALISAPKNSILIIEEIEIALHERALSRLIKAIIDVAKEKNLQVFFSSHWSGLRNFRGLKIFSFVRKAGHIALVEGYDPTMSYELTGSHDDADLVTLWVEDRFAELLLKRHARQRNYLNRVRVKIFGAADNLFSVAAYVALAKIENTYVVQDGDVDTTREKRIERLKSAITGDNVDEVRNSALSVILAFSPPNGEFPEQYIVNQYINLAPVDDDIKNRLQDRMKIYGPKEALMAVAKDIGDDYENICEEIISHLSKMKHLDEYMRQVDEEIVSKIQL